MAGGARGVASQEPGWLRAASPLAPQPAASHCHLASHHQATAIAVVAPCVLGGGALPA